MLSVAPSGLVYVAPPSRSPCIDAVCRYLGRTYCDSFDELRAVSAICASQYNAACLVTVCERAGRLACTAFEELAYASEACTGDVDGSCIDTIL